MNATEQQELRSALEQEQERLRAALAHLREDNGTPLEDVELTSQDDNHPADLATDTLDREIDLTIEESVETRLRDVDAALERIEDGTYGACANCGAEIPIERLRALPWATLCIDCKRAQELR
jgi:DnaK suppressor protein